MGFTEPMFHTSDGLNLSTARKQKKARSGWRPEIGVTYICRSERCIYPFHGRVEKLYDNSAQVVIVINEEVDDATVNMVLEERTIVNYKNMKELEEK